MRHMYVISVLLYLAPIYNRLLVTVVFPVVARWAAEHSVVRSILPLGHV